MGGHLFLDGTVVNGSIVLDGGAQLPEGARIRLEVIDPDDLAPPPEPYDRENELAILRESLADVRAGRGMPGRGGDLLGIEVVVAAAMRPAHVV